MKTILVIDDSPLILEMVSLILEDANFSVVSTQEAKRALQLCGEIKFDAILCDLCIAESDEASSNSVTGGLDIIWQILDKHPNIPIIAMSGKLERQDLGKMKRLGLCGAIQKPFTEDTLVRELKSVTSPQSHKSGSF